MDQEEKTKARATKLESSFDDEFNLEQIKSKKNGESEAGKKHEARQQKKPCWLNDFELDGNH